jgi:hypothetical protein
MYKQLRFFADRAAKKWPFGQQKSGARQNVVALADGISVVFRPMADGLSDLYQDLLTGSYDCVDRIVLNAYFRMGHSPGAFMSGGKP